MEKPDAESVAEGMTVDKGAGGGGICGSSGKGDAGRDSSIQGCWGWWEGCILGLHTSSCGGGGKETGSMGNDCQGCGSQLHCMLPATHASPTGV